LSRAYMSTSTISELASYSNVTNIDDALWFSGVVDDLYVSD